ncbi:unnamed protein product [Rotaria sp. Silwood1]|nr:unnamed protein product [Rotaria sp. Silwood1]
MSIEPEWYCPIIPTVLVNGAHGVGTGYSTDIPSYNPLALSNNMKYYIRQERERQRQLNNPTSEPKKYSDVITLEELIPWFKNFTGEIKLLDNDRTRGVINGVCAKLDESTLEITDLPIGTWTQQYKETVLEVMLHPKKNDITPTILDYKEYHTDTTVRFVVKLTHEQFVKFNEAGLHKSFRLQDTFKLTNMVLFDHNGILRRYKTAEEICEEFFMVRIQMYVKRKEYMVGTLKSQCTKLDNIARFIKEKIENVISVENKKISAVIEMLVERKYARDPEKVWREEAKKKFAVELATHAVHEDTDQLADLQQKQEDEENEDVDDSDNKKKKPKTTTSNQIDTTYYDYLINMSLRNLTKERREDILKDQKEKHDKLDALEKKSPEDLYEDDILNFEAEYRKALEKERADEMSEVAHPTTKKAGGDNKARKRQTTKPQRAETRPAPHDLQQKQEDEENEDVDDGDNKKKKPKTTTSNQIDTTYYDYLINMSLRNLTKERREDILKDQKEKHDKLDALEKKSPEDLYEDDILNFETEYRKALEKERADEMSDVAHPTTKKVGGDNKARKRQTTKPQRAETRPAPHGQRITPVLDPALVKKVNEEILKRTKEEKTVEDKKTIIEYLVKEGVTPEEVSNIMQMRCREKKKIGGVTEKKSAESKDKKLNGTIDENDENSNVSMMSVDGNDNSGLVKEEVTPKRNAQRTAKEKVTKYGGDNDEEDDDSVIHGMEIDDNESDYMGSDSDTEKKIKKANTKPKQPRKPKSATANNASSPSKKKTTAKKNASDAVMDNQENNDESSSPKNKKTEKPKKPRAKKESGATPKKESVKKEPKKVAKRPKSDDSDEDDIPILSNTPTPTKKPRTQRTAATKKSYHFSDDDDDYVE